ncbi:hypothetical protein ncot_18920 [Nocardioides sp. JQ2195]|uniref:hypothetical protein n=1 Tax=Nocardioides sp. JQ2195 TaxID=2592334 RepID=UPI00143EB92F|nr:hypothetical protein [Nocardioides sp. JQ2195]QIX28432.1 hypothetical protein ncot_18920 [Nocardioides sp. JQ2195]
MTAVAIGIGYLVAGIVGDEIGFGVFGLALMLAVGAAFVWAGRHSETVAGLLDRRDERINRIDAGASLFAGMSILISVIVMFMVEIARGQDGSPYYQLGALGGVSYVVALVWLRLRR